MNAMFWSLPALLIAIAGCQSTLNGVRLVSNRTDPDTYVRSALHEARLAYQRTGREMTLAGTGSPMPFSADVPACLVGLLTQSPRYLDALRRASGDDGVPFIERYMATYCMHFQIVNTSRFRLSFEGMSTDDGFCSVTVMGTSSDKNVLP